MAIQEIGITISMSSGTFNNTIYKNGKLQLTEKGVDGDGKIVYADSGTWESDSILIQDKIKSFKNIARTIVSTGGASYKIYVKTSDDGFAWGEYVEISADGSINNAPTKYAKVKVEFIPEKANSTFYIDKFDNASKYNNEFTRYDNGLLELKKAFDFDMDRSEISDGTIFTRTIPKSNLKKIDKISVAKK